MWAVFDSRVERYLQGKPIWLTFWGSWCPPYRAEMPEHHSVYERLQPEGVVLLAINLEESPLEAALFAASNENSYPIRPEKYQSATGAA